MSAPEPIVKTVTIPETAITVGNTTQFNQALSRMNLTLDLQMARAGLDVAKRFLTIFGWALLGLLVLLLAAFGLAALTAKDVYITNALDVFKTALAMFASLLAFVMGYYFGQNPPSNNGGDGK
ncbi:MAG TPA: hypothetical protein VK464_08310 [Symbiobacteriaceae bacterium]|jgi:hypothetical protein|nr:hypothetical protein [Symbiobacteriaceae bacterium]